VDEAAAARRLRRRRLVALRCVILLLVIAGAVPVAFDLAQPHGLYGLTEYDDGVAFAAAQRLTAGVFPYRDFVFLQPPGIAVVLAPFAALGHLIGGRGALGAARVMTAVAAGANAGLVGYLLRRRGLLAVGTAGLAMAVFPTGYTADHTFLLEPFCVFFCLLGVAVILSGEEVSSGRRCAIGGVLLGFAAVVKVFAVVPIVIVGVLILIRRRDRAPWFLLGVAIAAVVFVGPFYLLAPHAFVHDVISSQLGRSTSTPTPLLNRLFAVTGLAYAAPSLFRASNVPSLPAGSGPTTVAAVGLGLIVVFLLVRLALRNDRSALSWLIPVAALGAVGISFVPAAYYDHYAYFSAPFLALCLGATAGALVVVVTGVTAAIAPPRRVAVRRAIGAAALIALVGGSTAIAFTSIRTSTKIVDRFGDPGPLVAKMIPTGACTITDAESLLVSAGRSAIGPSGCPAIIDPTGVWLSVDPLHPARRSGISYPADPTYKDPALVAVWRAAFAGATYVVFANTCAWRIPWTVGLSSYFDSHFTHVAGPYGEVFRKGAPSTSAERPTIRPTCAETLAATAAAAH
jgi:hypothetical protein